MVPQLLILICIIINIAYSKPTRVKTALLSPSQTADNGAYVMSNIREVSKSDTWWNVNILQQNSWQFIIKADETFGIDTTYESTITFTANIPRINTQELLFAFTTDNEQYVSMSIPIDASMSILQRLNKIYPACSSSTAITDFGIGDIASMPQADRSCDIAGGSCDNWRGMLPPNTGGNAQTTSPITFTIKNDIISNEIIFSFHSNSFLPGFIQKCRFAQDFVSRNGLKIYIAGDQFGESYSISSFEITSSVQAPTVSPTYSPTQLPTADTISPTKNPISSPTYAPIQLPTMMTVPPSNKLTPKPSHLPTYYPTIPTLKPIHSPTHHPSVSPTKTPTSDPIQTPTRNPTPKPSSFPSLNPSSSPTNNPTGNTISPTRTPTMFPSPSPTHNPVTTSPTKYPTSRPTMRPTLKPTPVGMQFGAHDQLCEKPPVFRINKCEYSTDILRDTLGMIECLNPYDCCMCKTIECGFDGNPCQELIIMGEYAAYGVQEIFLAGNPASLSNGVSINCEWAHSCENAVISGTNIGVVGCDGEAACQNAQIFISNPKPDFLLNCADVSSCEGLNIKITLHESNRRGCMTNTATDIFMFSKINCNADRSCEGLQITIENNGCDKVMIQDLECIQPNSCNNAVFNLIGDIAIQNCQCGASCDTATGLEQCFMENINLFKYECVEPEACFGERKTIENPRNGFEFICSAMDSCKNSNFIIELNDSPFKLETVEHLSGFLISGDYSAQGATFIINNKQGTRIFIDKIECNGWRSCEDTTFITGSGVKVREIVCQPGACSKCYIKATEISVGVPCDPSLI